MRLRTPLVLAALALASPAFALAAPGVKTTKLPTPKVPTTKSPKPVVPKPTGKKGVIPAPGATIKLGGALPGRLGGDRPALQSDSILGLALAAETPKSKGSLAAFGSRKVEVAPGRDRTLAAITSAMLTELATFENDLKSAGSAVSGSVRTSTEVYELADAYVIVKSAGATIANPDALRMKSKAFRKAVNDRKASIDQSKLTTESKTGLAKFKKQLAKEPASHPLRKAMAKGDQALLDAIADGVGDIELVETLEIPKKVPRLDSQGRLVAAQ